MTRIWKCPDGGTCHHDCKHYCWRVLNCGPLSVFSKNTWPEEIRQAHAHNRLMIEEGFPNWPRFPEDPNGPELPTPAERVVAEYYARPTEPEHTCTWQPLLRRVMGPSGTAAFLRCNDPSCDAILVLGEYPPGFAQQELSR